MKPSPSNSPLAALLAAQSLRHRRAWRRAGACAALAGVASVALLGVSGWFLAAAAAAGLAGITAAQSFNYLLPSALVRLLAIVRTGTRYGERLLAHGAALRSMAAIRPALFCALCAAPAERALAVGAGDAATALMQDVAAIEDRLMRRPAPWAAIAALASGVALSALAGWAPALSTLLCAGATAAVARQLGRGRKARADELREAASALKDDLAMLAASTAELRCYGLQSWAAEHAAERGRRLMAAQRAHALDAGRLDLLLACATGIGAVLAVLLARSHGAPLAALAGLSAAMALEGLGPLLRNGLQSGVAARAAERLDALLATHEAGAAGLQVLAPASLELPLSPRLRLEPGARVAIVGPSGSGKTTLVETLLGLRPVRGQPLRLGGVDMARLDPSALRRHFAWLPQDAVLLGGTVRDNLALAAPDADDRALWQALHDAALDERVLALPQGLDTWLGEDGALLSGGERRRLALARAYLSPAPWLVLDEATEGLDRETESRVLRRLEARLDRTGQGLLAVSHRPAVVMVCDQVLAAHDDPGGYSTREYSARAESA